MIIKTCQWVKFEEKVNGFQEANTTVKQKRHSTNQVLPEPVRKS